LLPLLRAEADDARQLIEQLVSAHAEPLIKQVIKSKFHPHFDQGTCQDAEDLQSEVLVQLLVRLRAFKADPTKQAIGNFRGYVAVVTYRTFDNHLRRKYPQYHQLKNRLRYLLTHRPEFALWENEREVWLCGFARWRTTLQADLPGARLQQIFDDPQSFEQAGLHGRRPEQVNLAELLAAVFGWVGHPVELDPLVSLVAQLLGQTSQPLFVESGEESDSDPFKHLFDPRANPATEVEARQQLQRLWDEIKELSLQQRTALLLNLRDETSGNVIALLPHTGTATLRQIAEALALPAIELAELWPRLPLDDDTIALRLGLTRQQVINLRVAARRRLMRRMKKQAEPVRAA
jgi:RNA polymerase sigma factor (sigma-70 family)